MLTEAVGAAPTLPYDLFWIVWLAITVGGTAIVVFQTRHMDRPRWLSPRHPDRRRWLVLVPITASAVLLFAMALIAGDCHSVGPVGQLYSPSRCTESHATVGYAVLVGCALAVIGVTVYLVYRNRAAPAPDSYD